MVFGETVSGMSVKIGRVVGGEKTYVVGAPRSMEVGQVLLLQPEGDYLVIKLTLNGEQFGSGFGYDMAIGDFNNDGSVVYHQMPIVVDTTTITLHPFNGLFQTILDFTGARGDGVAVASAGPYTNHLHLAPDR